VINAGAEPQKISITSYKTYDGKELIEPGLTLAVYPTTNGNNYSATFTPYQMGQKNSSFLYEAVYNLTVALYYQDVAIGEQIKVNHLYSGENSIAIKNKDEFKSREYLEAVTRPQDLINFRTLAIEINPAEDILRDYLEVIRYVLEDIPRLLPWSIRSQQVLGYKLPTTSWSKSNENIYFHKAELEWELSSFAPATVDLAYFSPPRYINFVK